MAVMLKVKHLPTCECGVPDGYGDIEPCDKPAVAIVTWSDDECTEDEGLFVCEEHLGEIEEESEEEFEEESEEQSERENIRISQK